LYKIRHTGFHRRVKHIGIKAMRTTKSKRKCIPWILFAVLSCGFWNQFLFAQEPWELKAPLQASRQEVAVAELDGKVYVAGGLQGDIILDTVEVYDPTSDSWSFIAPMPDQLHHAAAVATAGKLYIIGGWNNFFGTPQDTLFEYEPTTDNWTQKASMPTRRGSPAAAVLFGKIYVVGGDPGENDFAVYDPVTDEWTVLSDMPTGREHMGAAAVGGRFYAVGGRTALLAGVGNVATLEVYDPGSQLWSALTSMPTARSGIAAASVEQFIIVFGGEGNPATASGTFSETEAYDTTTDTWTTLAEMPTARHGIGAAVVGNQFYIPAGGSVQGFSLTTINEVFNANVELSLASPGPTGASLLGAALDSFVLRFYVDIGSNSPEIFYVTAALTEIGTPDYVFTITDVVPVSDLNSTTDQLGAVVNNVLNLPLIDGGVQFGMFPNVDFEIIYSEPIGLRVLSIDDVAL